MRTALIYRPNKEVIQLRPLSTYPVDVWRSTIVLGVPFLTMLCVVLIGTPLFEGNDDAGLAMTGAGFGPAVAPEPHLIFSHFGYGLLLKFVSRFAGPYAHGWTTLAALGLSLGLYSRALCGDWRRQGYLVATALVIASGCVFARASLEPQFTITAALLFGTAVGCWLSTQREATRSATLSTAIYGALILGFMIRPAAAALGLIVVGPALLWLAWRGPTGGRLPARHFITAIAAIAVMAYLTDKAAYALSDDWRNVIAYNQLRALFNDFFRIPWIPGAPEYAKVGWSANDHAMFMGWYSLHPIFDYANIKFLAETLALQTPLLSWSSVYRSFAALWASPILFALAGVQFLLFGLFPQRLILAFLLLIGTLAAIIVSGLTGRPPTFRVLFSAMSVAFLFASPLLLLAEGELRPLQKAGLGFLVGIAIFTGYGTIQSHRERVSEAAVYRADLAGAAPYFSGTVIVWGSSLVWEWLVTPTTLHAPISGLTIPALGVFTRSPVMQAALQRLGISDLGTTLCTQPDIRLIATPLRVNQLQIFCEEHYHVRPAYDLVFNNPHTQIFVSGQPVRRASH
jgi:hypothetical protein